MTTPPIVRSLNVGNIRQIEFNGRHVTTGIWKSPASGRIALRGVNFAGDDQADRTVHGGPNKAVYAYAVEDYAWWESQGVETSLGLFGENLTTEGVDLTGAVVGQRWHLGTTVLEVVQPRLPCFKLGVRMGDGAFLRRFHLAMRPGAYLRVIEEGDVGAGDVITVSAAPAHGITLRDMVEALDDPDKAAALRVVPNLPNFWRAVADE